MVCFLVALLEGIDIQSMGVAAPSLVPEFHFSRGQTGFALSMSLIGMLIGAAVGGRLSDRIGRKTVMIASVSFLGLFSLATTVAWNFNSLLLARLLVGLGMGGAFPAVVATVSASADPRLRSTAIGAMYCGMPLGGAIAGALAAFFIPSHQWRPIFYFGGFGPLVVIPFLIWMLPAAANPPLADEITAEASSNTIAVLFGGRRAIATVLLWTSYFFTLLILYLLLNWLPSLLIANGLTKTQGLIASMLLNFGGVAGSLLIGVMLDRVNKRAVVALIYGGIVLALFALASLHWIPAVLAASAGAGVFAIGGQLMLYALSPNYYPPSMRGTGIGAAVAVGRLGAIAGPLLAGILLGLGRGASAVLITSIPCLLMGAAAAILLLRQPTP
jgi:MFS transporter, AAHS family, 3-hydroxyphenylpropionic acid transporter